MSSKRAVAVAIAADSRSELLRLRRQAQARGKAFPREPTGGYCACDRRTQPIVQAKDVDRLDSKFP